MTRDVARLLATGEQALRAGDWPTARSSFADALEVEELPQALRGLGEALWWLGDIRASLDLKERAYAAFRHAGDPGGAAVVALRLTIDHWANLGNAAASAGWLARARRSVDEDGLEPLRGWVALLEAYRAPDPAHGEELATQALGMARDAGDLDLELCALSQIGSCLIEQGRVSEGTNYLDEAMAGSLGGEGSHPDTVVFTSCNTMISCTSCAEFERAVQWVRAADRFTERFGCPFLYAECRTLYGSVLVATGDWPRAEEELHRAIEASAEALPALHTQALAALADLRLAQGRLEEAERLLVGLEGEHAATATSARLRLARGQPAAAAAMLGRWLTEAGGPRLDTVVPRELLGEALLAQGETERGAAEGHGLTELGRDEDCAVAVARGERLLGRAAATSTELDTARDHLDVALSAFDRLGMPYEAARTRLALAETLRPDAPDVAGEEARLALATFEGLRAARDADAAAALLRELGTRVTRTSPQDADVLTTREHEVLELLGDGLSNPEIAERLYISRKTVEHHVARVLTKLGLRSRSEAAAEVVRKQYDRSRS